MQKTSIILLVLFFISCQTKNDSLDGKTFVGIEKSSGCSDFILARNTFTFYGDSVILRRKFIKHFSKIIMKQSYQYKGLVIKKDSKIIIDVFAYKCPDCQLWNQFNVKTDKLEKLLDRKTYEGYYKDGNLILNYYQVYRPLNTTANSGFVKLGF